MSTYNVVGFVQKTIATSAVTLIAEADIPDSTESFVGRVATASVRMKGFGTDPTTNVGVVLNAGDVIILSKREAHGTKFIRDGGTSGEIAGHFYTAPVSMFYGG